MQHMQRLMRISWCHALSFKRTVSKFQVYSHKLFSTVEPTAVHIETCIDESCNEHDEDDEGEDDDEENAEDDDQDHDDDNYWV